MKTAERLIREINDNLAWVPADATNQVVCMLRNVLIECRESLPSVCLESRTEEGQRIAELEAQAQGLAREKAEWQEARRQGREEALSILLRHSAEDFPSDYQGSAPLADTGDYVTHWKEKDLRTLFSVDSTHGLVERMDGAYYEMASRVLDVEQERDEARHKLAEQIAYNAEWERQIQQLEALLARMTADRDALGATVKGLRDALENKQ